MATTIYRFQSDLQGLKALNLGLQEAKANLAALKKGTASYAASSKNVGGMTQSLKNNTRALGQTRTAANNLNKSGRGLMTTFKGASIAIVSAFAFRAIMSGMRGIITIFAKFESRMAAVRAISGSTEVEFKRLVKSARDLGETTVFTATEVAKLQEELSRLGFEAPQILAMQAAIINLAAATGESLSKAAEVAGAQINAFGLEAEQAVRVTDVMGFAFANSALNLERFTQSMKFVAPVAKTAGFTIEETSAMLMTLADNGIHGSIAGNALKNIFLRLGDANSKLNKEIGYTVQGLPQLIGEMNKMNDATFGLTQATELLDKRSAPAFLTLLRNIEELEIAGDQINHVEGAISRMASIRLDTLEGDFTLLKSATEGLGLAVGESFNFELRKSVYLLTKWVRGIASSEETIARIKGVLFGLIQAVKLLVVRMIVLKLATFTMGGGFAAAIKPMQYFIFTLRAAAIGAASFKDVMIGLKGAILSTGVGALVIGLGSLVAYLNSASDSAEETAWQMDRLNESFQDELDVIQSLAIATTERHDKLREMNATYKELLGNIDLEILKKEQLEEVGKIVEKSALSSLQKQKADTQKLLDAEKLRREQNAGHYRDKIKETKELMKLNDGEGPELRRNDKTIPFMNSPMDKDSKGNYMFQVEMDKKAWEAYLAQIEIEKKGRYESFQYKIDQLSGYIEDKDEELKKEAQADALSRGIDIDAAETYRMELRDVNLNNLEDFREMSHSKQKITEEDAELNLEDFQRAQQLVVMQEEINAERNSGEIELADKHQLTLDRMLQGSSTRAQKHFNDFKDKQNAINVMISEYTKYVTNLTSVLDDSGPAYKSSALSGFRLQKTKERLKELLKIQISQINDSFEHDMASNDASFKQKMIKYEKEGDLMRTNIKSIETISNKSKRKQIIADIKSNRSNYDVLKNLDEATWTKMIVKKRGNNAFLQDLLDKMNTEEQSKLKINKEILLEIDKEYANEKLKIEIENRATIGDLEQERLELKNKIRNTDISNLLDNQKTTNMLLKADHDEQLRQDIELNNLGEMSDIEFKNRQRKRDEEVKEKELKDYQEKLAAFSEMYSAMSDVVMAVSANISQRNMERIETEHEQRSEDLNNAFERDLELAEKNGGDTEAMQRTHDNKMEALEDIKSEKILNIKRRQFHLEKANNVAMALINGAQAVAKVTAQTGVGSVIAVPITLGLIASQLAVIMAQRFTGAKGGIIPGGDDKFAQGGLVHGPNHANGGVKFAVGGRVAELEGGEAVINKRSTAMFHGQLSAMNQAGGGKKFAVGGITPGTRAALDGAKGNWNVGDIAELISSSINSQQVYVSESEISSTQSSIGVTESLSTLFK